MRRAAALGLVLAAAAACSQGGPAISVEQPQVRASLGSVPTSAAYLVIRNRGGQPDRLMQVSCACAEMVMPHQTTSEGGVARMAHEAAVTIPAGGSVAFTPGGRHLMLTGLKAPIRAGEQVAMTLTFEKAGAVPVTFAAVDTPSAGGR